MKNNIKVIYGNIKKKANLWAWRYMDTLTQKRKNWGITENNIASMPQRCTEIIKVPTDVIIEYYFFIQDKYIYNKIVITKGL